MTTRRANRRPVTFARRCGCALSNLVYAMSSPFVGFMRGMSLGLRLSPRLPGWVQMLTTYIVPIVLGGGFGLIGFVCGVISAILSLWDVMLQFITYDLYSYPRGRSLVDRIPGPDPLK